MRNRAELLKRNLAPSWKLLCDIFPIRSFPSANRFLAGVVLVFVVMTTTTFSFATPKRVLLVYQNDGYSPAALEFQQSVLGGLRKGFSQDLEFYCEQLDSTRMPESREQVLAGIRSRYAERGIDVVILLGTVPTDILHGVPVIYVGTPPQEFFNNTANRDNSLEIWYKVDVNKTIAVARHLQPSIKDVLVVTGSGVDDHVFLKEVHSQLQGSDVPVEYLADASMDALLNRVAHLPSHTMLLPISYTRDAKGSTYYSRDVIEAMARASSVPVYTVVGTVIGTGVVGGYVVDFKKTGEVVADAAIQLLRGKSPAQINVSSEGTGSYVFDWRQLKRWGYLGATLPAGSIVQFRTISVWEQYRWQILAIVVLMLAKLFLILYLLSTQKKRAVAEASLRSITGRLLESQDEERRRFARDLHDGTGQHLSAVALILGQVLAMFPAGHENLRELLQDSHSASRLALDEVRTVSFALHPPLLEGLGLVPAIGWYLEGLRKRTKLKIDFAASDEIEYLSPESQRALFRIVQESVGNVLRHSGGAVISVVLSEGDDGVTLEIRDDGRGMTKAQVALLESAATIGVGICGMRERINQLKGTFKIESSANGTRVLAVVPIDEERYAAHFAGR